MKILSHKRTIFAHTILYVNNFFYTFLYDILRNGKYYLFGGQYSPINGFKFTFNRVIQLHSLTRTWNSLCVNNSFTRTESDWGNLTRTLFEWSLCGITSSENFNFLYVILLIGIICPFNRVLLTDGIFQKGNYGSDERIFLSH